MTTATLSQALVDAANAEWARLRTRLPADLEASARHYGAFGRRHKLRSAEDLLRLVFGYACGQSLRSLAGWAERVGIAEVSNVALDKRLRRTVAWLAYLVGAQLAHAQEVGASDTPGRVRLLDATTVERPGATGTDWRLHVGLHLPTRTIDHLSVTGADIGESYVHFPVEAGDLALADRAYGTRRGIAALHARGAFPVVRINRQNCPLLDAQGAPCDLLALAKTLPRGGVGEWAVQTKPTRDLPAIPGRLIIVALTAEEAAGARQRLGKRTKRKGRRRTRGLDSRTVAAAGYVFIFTTLPAARLSAALVAALFRLRWQVEVAFKRLKQILRLGDLRAHTDALCQVCILARLLLALLTDDLLRSAGAFSP